MVDASSATRISTHYYKIAYLLLVTYAVYTAKEPTGDQFLLELELQIRNQHPKIMLTYYNKLLYYFRFDHLKERESGPDQDSIQDTTPKVNASNVQLHLLYPQLLLKHESTVPAEQLANPSRVMKSPAGKKDNNSNDELPDGHLAFASLSFLKAVKKTLVYNLSASGNMLLFGNYAVARVTGTSAQYAVVQIDPVLLANGDLIVSLSQRSKLALFDSSILNLDHVFQEMASCFVIYVIPSGLRCHLYDTTSMQQSFTYTPPKSSANLLRLLKLSTGVDLKERQQILWVKIIPNLQHLNNQTSRISRFVHDVDNKKYILWPWELCLLQFGSVERNPIHHKAPTAVDPLSLISDFIQFSILRHENVNSDKNNEAQIIGSTAAQNHTGLQQPFSVPSGFSTGMSTGGNDVKVEDTHISILEVDPEALVIFQIDNGDELFGDLDVLNTSLPINLHSKDLSVGKEDPDDNDSDLFGSSPELDSKSTDRQSLDTFQPIKRNEGNLEKKEEELAPGISVNQEQERIVGLQSYGDDSLMVKGNSEQTLDKPAYINIPRDQMISAPINITPMSYDDPGAPPAIMPTPVIPQNASGIQWGFAPQLSVNSQLTPKMPLGQFSQPGKPLNPFAPKEAKEAFQADENLSYVFSPILFNPMIKSNIDTKYGKGGKFYVARENSTGPEDSKFRLRETSVSGFENKKELHEFNISPEQKSEAENTIKISHTESGSYDEGNLMTKEEDVVNDEEYEEDDDEEEEEEEESDVDEELDVNELKTSPLKLNTHSGDIFQMTGPSGADLQRGGVPNNSINFQSSQANNFLSPGSGVKNSSAIKIESPFGFGIGTVDGAMSSFSPPIANDLRLENQLQIINRNDESNIHVDNNRDSGTNDSANTPLSSSSSSNGVSESSNCLPLILRNINVFSIPNSFILKKIPGAWGNVPIAAGFNMDVDEEEDDFDNARGELSVRLKNLDECLKWLTPNLVFDLGLINFEKHLQHKLPDFFSDEVVDDITDGEVSSEVKNIFLSAFPLSYRVRLNEFISEEDDKDKKASDSQAELDNQLSFLDDITNDDILNPETSIKKLRTLHWDSIYAEEKGNLENFNTYKELLDNIEANLPHKKINDKSVFKLNEVKTKVYKNGDDIVNLNFVGVKFWNYFNFSPNNGPKRFQVLLISENNTRNQGGNLSDSSNLDFLDLLKNNYKEGHFGTIKKLNLQTFETRPDLEGISNGLMLVDKDIGDTGYREFYKKINKKLKSLAELIKLDLINKTNRFEFDRPLLLLFVNFDSSINSVLQISKICRNFKLFLNDHQLSLVNTFTHIIPWNYIIKQSDMRRRLRYLSNSKLSKFSMTLYNKCPNIDNHDTRIPPPSKDDTKKLFTNLVKEPPSTLHFKFLNKINKEGYSSTFHDDIFLHVAYERSIDKNWVSAAWSDPLGIVTHTKSWYCSSTAIANGTDAHELGSLINEIWEISNKLFKKLNEDAVQSTCGSGAKNFLVLTRISSIIPDDELVFWKRLTTKHKDVSLLVLSANRLPKYLFSSELAFSASMETTESKMEGKGNFDELTTPTNFLQSLGHGRTSISSVMSGADFLKSMNGISSAMSPSSSGVGINISSPQHFLNATSNFLSPLEAGGSASATGANSMGTNEAEYVLKDPRLEILGVIPQVPLPSFNSPTRLGMRIGYLIREAKKDEANSEIKYIVFEVTLLSCSSYWNLDAIMKILLNQYKKLIVLNEVLGACDREHKKLHDGGYSTSELRGLVPWHINAVVKTLDYLVHVNVDEQI